MYTIYRLNTPMNQHNPSLNTRRSGILPDPKSASTRLIRRECRSAFLFFLRITYYVISIVGWVERLKILPYQR